MLISSYLNDTKYAASKLIDNIWHEYNELSVLSQEIIALEAKVNDGYTRAKSLMDSDDPDDAMLGVGVRWGTYFDEDKSLYHKEKEKADLEQRISIHEYSIISLSAALLQIAKQGISVVYGDLASCPNGRAVKSQFLKDVIWQARNQTMHYEEGNCRGAIVSVFTKLVADFDSIFSRYNTDNLAFEIIKVLGWKSYELYEADMITLV